MARKALDLTGRVLGDFTVIEKAPTEITYSKAGNKSYWARWLLRCNHCGATKISRKKNIVSTKNTKRNPTCMCRLLIKCSETAKKTFRSGTDNITGTHWNSIVRGAESRGIELSITLEDAQQQLELQDFRCALTKQKLTMDLDNSYWLNGVENNNGSLDRIDSSKGYTKDNIQWVLKEVNFMKGSMETSRLVELCSLIVENNGGGC